MQGLQALSGSSSKGMEALAAAKSKMADYESQLLKGENGWNAQSQRMRIVRTGSRNRRVGGKHQASRR
jgi:hypothetical protein